MIIATLDTNVIFAGLYSKRGASYQILQALIRREFIPAISVSLFLEYEDVLKRPDNLAKLGLTVDDVECFLTYIGRIAHLVEHIYFRWRPMLPDETDNLLVECAVTSNSRYLVTFNTRHFKQCEGIFSFTVIAPKDFLEILRR